MPALTPGALTTCPLIFRVIRYDGNLNRKIAFDFLAQSKHSDNKEYFRKRNPSHFSRRRSTRLHRPNPKYFNNYFETVPKPAKKGDDVKLTSNR